MITLKELLKGVELDSIPKAHQSNLFTLLERISKVREAWGRPMVVTSGYRSMEDHIRIYKDLAIKRKKEFKMSDLPMKSRHLQGSAVDISDPDGELFDWCKANKDFLADIELWMEEKDDQPRVHFQIFPPKSGSRFFIP